MTVSALREMSDMNIRDVELSGLVSLESVRVSPDQDVFVRTRDYLGQIRNPYCFLVGGTPVKLSFRDAGKPLDHALLHYFLSLGR